MRDGSWVLRGRMREGQPNQPKSTEWKRTWCGSTGSSPGAARRHRAEGKHKKPSEEVLHLSSPDWCLECARDGTGSARPRRTPWEEVEVLEVFF